MQGNFKDWSARVQRKAAGATGDASGSQAGRVGLLGTALKLSVGAITFAYLATNCLFNVEGGHRAVMFSRLSGIQDRVVGEGTHLMVPWLHRPEIFSIRVKARPIVSLTGTKDLQMVNLTLRILSRPVESKLPTIYRTLGKDYDDRVIPSIANEVMKATIAQYTASQLLSMREKISAQIKANLTERARQFNIVLDDVLITNIAFGKEFTNAIEAKQVASQEVERAKFVVEKALQDKLQIIARAEGEALSAKMISDVIRENPAYLDLKKIEFAREIANVLAKSNNRIFLSSDNLLVNTVSLLNKHSDATAPK
jgi:prohibitin 2